MGERLTTRARRESILLDVHRGHTTVEDLAAQFGVTASTIRRDLAILTERDQLTRTYGGAAPSVRTAEAPLSERSVTALRAKRAIAAWSEKQILAGETIIIDAGSTAGHLAHALRSRSELTVITPGLTAMLELADATGIEVICLGGELRHVSQGMVGPITEAALEKLTADKLFLGADGITPDLGICEAAAAQTRLKELMMQRSRDIYVIVDSSKINSRPFNFWARMPGRWTLVTDESVADSDVRQFTSRGVDVAITHSDGSAEEHSAA
jgi:DeoR/GlpR family transcriptional regulator of sugar metabolism